MGFDCIAIDNTWGPWAGRCRGGLDFTLLFEEALFVVLPTALLLVAAPIQVAWLRGQTKKLGKGVLLPLKQVGITPSRETVTH